MPNNSAYNLPLRSIDTRDSRPSNIKRAVIAFGRLGSNPNVSDSRAFTYGRRRLAAIAAPVVAGLVGIGMVNMARDSQNRADAYVQKIEACASTLTGDEVDLARDPATDMPMIPAEHFEAVRACQYAQGDVTRAEARLQP